MSVVRSASFEMVVIAPPEPNLARSPVVAAATKSHLARQKVSPMSGGRTNGLRNPGFLHEDPQSSSSRRRLDLSPPPTLAPVGLSSEAFGTNRDCVVHTTRECAGRP